MRSEAGIVLKTSIMISQELGFEKPPTGRLLEQVIDFSKPMGLAYERSIGFEKGLHVHDRHMIVCPRSSCRMDVFDTAQRRYEIDARSVLWVPKGLRHSDRGESAIYDTLALFPSDEYVAAMLMENGLDRRDGEELKRRPTLVARTKWLDDILDRYFFERILNAHSPVGCTFFLEKQIINELARIMFHKKLHQDWTKSKVQPEPEDSFNRALRFIEANLFSAIDLQQIAEASHASPSTISRRFKENTGQSPYEYIKARRLDEALRLLKKGGNAVGDIALLVGYEDFSAFSRAFRARFGKAPSIYQKANQP